MAEKTNIYQKELENLQQGKDFLKRKEYSKMDIQLEFKKMVENYEELVDQVKIITKISDRLQKKLNKTNEKLADINDQLNDKNIQLNETIDALTEAKIGRRASTIVLVIVVILFLLSEAWIEPIIEANFDNFFIGLGLKFVMALLIKPAETLTERYLLRKARKEQIRKMEKNKIVASTKSNTHKRRKFKSS